MKEKTLADHAEEWCAENNQVVPQRDTDEWRIMYENWHSFAFESLVENYR